MHLQRGIGETGKVMNGCQALWIFDVLLADLGHGQTGHAQGKLVLKI